MTDEQYMKQEWLLRYRESRRAVNAAADRVIEERAVYMRAYDPTQIHTRAADPSGLEDKVVRLERLTTRYKAAIEKSYRVKDEVMRVLDQLPDYLLNPMFYRYVIFDRFERERHVLYMGTKVFTWSEIAYRCDICPSRAMHQHAEALDRIQIPDAGISL